MAEALIRRVAAVLLLTAALTHCASPPPPPRRPQPAPVILPPLAEPGASLSTWINLPDSVNGRIGRDTGFRILWYRCLAPSPGWLRLSLLSASPALKFQLFDDSVVTPSRRDNPTILGGGSSDSAASTRTFDITGGVYYIEVATSDLLNTDDFVLTVSFTATAPPVPPPVSAQKQKQRPKPRPAPVPPPAPSEPEPVEQSIGDAALLVAPITDAIGNGERYAARVYSVSVPQPSTLSVTLKPAQGRVGLLLLDAQHRVLKVSPPTAFSHTLTAEVQPGTYYVRTVTEPGSHATYSLSRNASETLVDPADRTNALDVTSGRAYDVSVGQRTGYRAKWARSTVTKPSYYVLCVSVIGAPVRVRTFKGTNEVGATLLTHSGVVEGSTAATTLYFRVESPNSQHSDVFVRLTLHEKSPDAGFKSTKKVQHNCP